MGWVNNGRGGGDSLRKAEGCVVLARKIGGRTLKKGEGEGVGVAAPASVVGWKYHEG